jgi:catechol 2,3-dioxygenase-like lactoylglutathione lyase family enzyme
MVTKISHLVFSVRPENLSFYKDLMAFLGWQLIYADDMMIGVRGSDGASVWYGPLLKDYDGPGLNHFAIGAPSQADVDAVCEYLKERDIPALFETPRHRPEFSSDDRTYYQVMFESPDRILYEVVYTGPKTAAA